LSAASPFLKLDFFKQQVDHKATQPRVLDLNFCDGAVSDWLARPRHLIHLNHLGRFAGGCFAPTMQGHHTDPKRVYDVALHHPLRRQIVGLSDFSYDLRFGVSFCTRC
jgi:hypothetical protein